MSASQTVPTLRAASAGEHLWVAAPPVAGQSGGARILHAVRGSVRECGTVDAMPDALVASESQLWMIMPASAGAGTSPVYSVRAAFNPISDRWFSEPIGRFDVLPSVPAGGHLSGAASEGQQLLVLQGADPPALMEQRGAGWVRTDLPPWLPAGTMLHQWPAREGSGWALVARDGNDLRVWTRPASEPGSDAAAWSTARMPGSGDGMGLVVSGASRPTVLRRSGPDGAWTLSYARADGPLDIARITAPDDQWTVVGSGDSFSIVTVGDSGQLGAAPIDSVEGTVGAVAPIVEAPSTAGEWLHLPLIGAVTVAALLAAFLVRPPVGDRVPSLPAGWEPMDAWRRVLGLAIDMVPGAIVAIAATGCALQDLLAMPAWTAVTAKAVPSSIMLACTVVWCVVWELCISTTPGKLAIGKSRVVKVDRLTPREHAERAGGAVAEWPSPVPSPARRAMRALLKGVVIFAPALAFLAFVHPMQMGLPDVITDTAVARRRR